MLSHVQEQKNDYYYEGEHEDYNSVKRVIREYTLVEAILCWSIPHNWERLTMDVGGKMKSLNGIRVFSMFYVILGHTIVFMSVSSPVATPTYLAQKVIIHVN